MELRKKLNNESWFAESQHDNTLCSAPNEAVKYIHNGDNFVIYMKVLTQSILLNQKCDTWSG